jgi:hypothetical protein
MAKVKTVGKGGAKQNLLKEDRDYSMGVKTWKVGVTDPDYAQVGNLRPADIRAINIKKANAILQEKWAKEWFEGIKQIKSSQKEIEKIRCDIEKLHFKTEAEIDEYVLGGLLAKVEYEAHFREWTARKNQETKFINGGAGEEIRIVAAEFADRLRVRKVKTDQRIQASKVKADAQIAQLGKEKDTTDADAIERERKRLEAFMRGDDMDIVESIGSGGTDSTNRSDAKILDSLISGNLFNFK